MRTAPPLDVDPICYLDEVWTLPTFVGRHLSLPGTFLSPALDEWMWLLTYTMLERGKMQPAVRTISRPHLQSSSAEIVCTFFCNWFLNAPSYLVQNYKVALCDISVRF